MSTLWQLFCTFFKLGAFTFGGGYAMISLIENEVVTKRSWLTSDEMLDIITIAESTPGPIAINMATFVGTKVKGFVGALIATLGLIIPPFVIILCITLVLDAFKEITLIAYALRGIQAGVVVLILNAFLKFLKGMDKSILSFVFLIVAFVVALLTDFSVVLIILIGAIAGIAISLISSLVAKRRSAKDAISSNTDTSSGVNDVEPPCSVLDVEADSDNDRGENQTTIDADNATISEDIEDDTTREPSPCTDSAPVGSDTLTHSEDASHKNNNTYSIDTGDEEDGI